MLLVTTTPSPQTPNVVNAQADGSANFLATGAVGGFVGQTDANVGTFISFIRSVFFLTFEINAPNGSIFDAVSVGIVGLSNQGVVDSAPVLSGFVAGDGVWNTGGDAGTGFVEYTNVEDIPHPDTEVDALWQGGSAVSLDTWEVGNFPALQRATFGFGLSDLTFEDPAWLSKFQASFDENQQFRTSRGVPVFVMFVPTGNDSRVFTFGSVNGAEENRPILSFSISEDTRAVEFEKDVLSQYLPSGIAFQSKNDTTSNLSAFLRGMAPSFSRMTGDLDTLKREVMPDNTVLFLSEWERALGIPDDCLPQSVDADERRKFIILKLVDENIQTNKDFVDLALNTLGLVVEVQSGIISFNMGDPNSFGTEKVARFTIVITFTGTSNLFPFTFPFVFGSGDIAIMECLYSNLRPANCDLLFLSV